MYARHLGGGDLWGQVASCLLFVCDMVLHLFDVLLVVLLLLLLLLLLFRASFLTGCLFPLPGA